MGITDYLHELELWRRRVVTWQAAMPWPGCAEAIIGAEEVLWRAARVWRLGRAVRQVRGHDEGLPDDAVHGHSRAHLDAELLLARCSLERAEDALRAEVPPDVPPPPALPRGRVAIER